MTKAIDLSIVIVTYNACAIANECVNSFLQAISKDTVYNYELVIVDNSENNDVVNSLKNKGPLVTVINNHCNVGYAKASNIGYAQSHGEFVLFSNPDIVVNEQTLPNLVTYLKECDKDVGACAPLIYLKGMGLADTDERDLSSHKGSPTIWNVFTHYSGLAKLCQSSKRLSSIFGRYYLMHRDFSVVHEVESITGGFFAVKRAVFEEVGQWDEDYFLFGEDVELSYQIRKRGYKIIFIPQATAKHYQGATTGLFKFGQTKTHVDRNTVKRSRKEFYAAMKKFFDKNFQRKRHKVVRPIIFAGIALREGFDIFVEKCNDLQVIMPRFTIFLISLPPRFRPTNRSYIE